MKTLLFFYLYFNLLLGFFELRIVLFECLFIDLSEVPCHLTSLTKIINCHEIEQLSVLLKNGAEEGPSIQALNTYLSC